MRYASQEAPTSIQTGRPTSHQTGTLVALGPGVFETMFLYKSSTDGMPNSLRISTTFSFSLFAQLRNRANRPTLSHANSPSKANAVPIACFNGHVLM